MTQAERLLLRLAFYM